MANRKLTQSERAEMIIQLAQMCPRGTTLYTVLRSVSASGMSRKLDIYVICDNTPQRITWQMCQLGIAGMSYDNKSGSARLSGCGMDRGFHAVYSLSSVLYGHEDRGAYALSQSWM